MSIQPAPRIIGIADPERLTAEEYLWREKSAEFRSELRDGVMVAMAGAPRRHNIINGNFFALLWMHLQQSDCDVYQNDMRVRLPDTRNFAYPDLVVACEPNFADDREDVLLNPTLIVEVISPSTGEYDRGEKAALYRQIPTLRDYLLVSQSAPEIERWTRRGDLWVSSQASGLDATLVLENLNPPAELRLSALYSGVTV